jgi:TatD DNase family protein
VDFCLFAQQALKMNLTDTHTHLHFDQYRDDLPEVIRRAEEDGLKKILTLGTDLKSSREAVRIANQYEMVYAAVGIHPTDVHHSTPADFPEIKMLARNEEKVVAIGEIGLDLYWKEVPLQDQLPVLDKMLEIAAELNLPVVIHNRDAQPEMRQFFADRKIQSLQGVMHSFAGSSDDAQFYLNRELYISFTGVITFKNFKSMDVVKSVPVERLLLETDSPFLAPVPRRGKRNEPAFVRHIADKLAEVHSVPVEKICSITYGNAEELFKW